MTTWSVTIESAGIGTVPTPAQFFSLTEALAAHGAAVTGSPEEPADGRCRYGAALTVEADDVIAAVSTAAALLVDAATSVGLPRWPIVVVEALEESELDRQLGDLPVLLGVREVAKLLGVSPQRASALARSKAFPKPASVLASGPVWAEPVVRDFVADWTRRPGPRKSA